MSLNDEEIMKFFEGEDSFDDYQKKARTFAIYDKKWRVLYPAYGIASEAGEVSDKIKKWIRDGAHDKAEIAKELGDLLWYIAIMAGDLGYDLSEVAKMNIDKLSSRKQRDKIKGSGDNR